MNNHTWEKIIEHQLNVMLQERCLKIGNLKEIEKIKMKLQIALDLLSELG